MSSTLFVPISIIRGDTLRASNRNFLEYGRDSHIHLLKSFYDMHRMLISITEYAEVDLILHWAHCITKTHRFKNIENLTYITKTCLYNFDPLKPHFYIVKLGFTGVYIIFLISAQNIDCGYSLEPPRQGGSNEYPQSMF